MPTAQIAFETQSGVELSEINIAVLSMLRPHPARVEIQDIAAELRIRETAVLGSLRTLKRAGYRFEVDKDLRDVLVDPGGWKAIEADAMVATELLI